MSTYEITIKVDNSESISGSAGQTTATTDELAQGSSDTSVFKELKTAVAATGVVAAGTKMLNYITTRVYPETGNRQLQDNINAAKQVGGQILSIVGAFAVGGIAGGLVATGLIALDYVQQERTYAYNRSMEATTLSLTRERMGIGGMAISRSRALNQ